MSRTIIDLNHVDLVLQGVSDREFETRVRGIIVAREISEDLRLACSYLPTVGLYEYELSVLLKRVELEIRDA